uniref:Uncharacterized protein n=1 Tax=CrAss-like virus sp. ctXt06 TaxID=2825837 RepID=A0A8S5V6R3_9CAUD|nr:MAG TPA: hypothetical protein [CrAss-like virus sp. ctXt06]
MKNQIVKDIIKAVNDELKNGLICIVFEDKYRCYNCYEPVEICDDSNAIKFYDDCNEHIILYDKDICNIEVFDM